MNHTWPNLQSSLNHNACVYLYGTCTLATTLRLHTKEGHSELIDFREVAPSAASQDMYRDRPVEASRTGGLSVAVPGELAGLEYAWQQHGSGHVAWKDLVMPSAQLARNFTVPALLAKWIAVLSSSSLT